MIITTKVRQYWTDYGKKPVKVWKLFGFLRIWSKAL